MIVVVIGVSASGKTAVGKALAARLHLEFADADDFHSPANVAKMRAGVALDENDRAPWLQSLHDAIVEWERAGTSVVLACSALRRAHRDKLRVGDVHFFYLAVDEDTLADRMRSRHHAFMPASLLRSQLDTLEVPTKDDAETIDGGQPLDTVVTEIASQL